METLRQEVIGNKPLSIIDKLGGEAILTRIVHVFFDKIEEHHILSPLFKKAEMGKIRKHFLDFLVNTLGGITGRLEFNIYNNI